jgi:hypothetical protein
MILITRFPRRRGMLPLCVMGVAHSALRARLPHRCATPATASRPGEENNHLTGSMIRFRFAGGGFFDSKFLIDFYLIFL